MTEYLPIIIKAAIILAIVFSIIIFFWMVHSDKKDLRKEQEERERLKLYHDSDWRPKYHLSHEGVRVFNIPFTPIKTEVFYLENEYNAAANRFVTENIDAIRSALARKGMTFIYLPYVHATKKEIESMLDYSLPNGDASKDEISDVQGLKSNFLLDYMVKPENRHDVKYGLAWYGHSEYLFNYKKELFVFDYIAFDGAEALEHPQEVLEDMLPEIGRAKNFIPGAAYIVPYSSEESDADDNFGNVDKLDDEDKEALEKIEKQLDAVRKQGISEAVIAKYVTDKQELSRMTIKNDFTIILNDYNDMQIEMEPLVKSLYILFLRHPEGFKFKELPDHAKELEIIYRCVKEKKNEIDKLMASSIPLKISKSVSDICDATKNSVNEKCSRIKEAFVKHFQDTLAKNYYVNGGKFSNKMIPLSRKLIKWED